MARNEEKRLEIKHIALISDYLQTRVYRLPDKSSRSRWRCSSKIQSKNTKMYLPLGRHVYPQILPHVMRRPRRWRTRECEIIHKVAPRYSATVVKLLPQAATAISCQVSRENHSRSAQISGCFESLLAQFTINSLRHLITTQHSVQWFDPLNIKFLAFVVVTRWFHPRSCNSMLSFKSKCSPACHNTENFVCESSST